MVCPKSEPVEPKQLALTEIGSDHPGGTANLSETFRRLYYHLYSNSSATRAERIIQDLSLVLLLKFATESDGLAKPVAKYMSEGGDPNLALLPLLRETFPGLIDEGQRFGIGADAVRGALHEIWDIRLSTAPAHVLGEAFQALMGPRLRGDRGQFFTPRSLVRAMVAVVDPGRHESVLDPACGTGGFLIETLAHERFGSEGPSRGRVVGIDKDRDMARLASALLQIVAKGRSLLRCFDSLDERNWTDGLRATDAFDVVLTNPPFGARIGVRDKEILRQFEFGHQWVPRGGSWVPTSGIRGSQDPQVLFLELCVRRLRDGGRLGIVLPEGVFGNRELGYVWDWLRAQGKIFALLDCPRTTFQPSTDTKTNVLFFQKVEPVKSLGDGTQPVPHAKVAVALHAGHDRRGRTHLSDGQSRPDDFLRLGKAFTEPGGPTNGWRTVALRNPYYLVPRYYIDEGPITADERELIAGAELVSLGELVAAKLLSIRKGHEVGADAYGSGDIAFVRTSDIANFEITVDPTKSVSEEVYRSFAPLQKLRPGDVLLVVDGRYRIGSTALLTEQNYRCVVQSHFRILSLKHPEELEPCELLFALALPSVRMRIRDLVFIQSTLGTLGGRLLELRIPLLHGNGAWRERIEAFRTVLEERNRLLARVKSMTQADHEL